MIKIRKKIIALICVITMLATCFTAWRMQIVDAEDSSSEVTPVYLEGFRNLTTSSFVDSSGNQMKNQQYTSSGSYSMKNLNSEGDTLNTFDKTLLSLKLDFEAGSELPSDLSKNLVAHWDFEGDAETVLKDKATAGQVNDDLTEQNNDTETNVVIADGVATITGNGYLKAGGSSVDLNQTGKMTIFIRAYVDGLDGTEKTGFIDKRSKATYQYGLTLGSINSTKVCQTVFDSNNGSTVNQYSDKKTPQGEWREYAIVVDGEAGQITHTLYRSTGATTNQATDFEQVYQVTAGSAYPSTINNFLMVGNSRVLGSDNSTANTSDSIRKIDDVRIYNTALTTEQMATINGTTSRIEVAGNSNNNGWMIYPNATGTILYIHSNGMQETNRCISVKAEDILEESEVADGYFLNEFILQMSFVYSDSDSDGTDDRLTLGVYVNGKECTKLYNADTGEETSNILTGCDIASKFGSYFTVCIDENGGKPITVSSVVPHNDNLTKLTWSDFVNTKTSTAAEDGAINQNAVYKLNNDSISNLASTSFEAKITYSVGAKDTCSILYGGTVGEKGFQLRPNTAGQLLVRNYADLQPDLGLARGNYIRFYPNTAGMNVDSFIGNEVKIKITTEFADYNGDGDANDVQLGVYFDGKLYNDQYVYAYDCRADFGNYISFYATEGTIKMNSVTHMEEIAYNLENGSYPLGPGEKYVDGESTVITELTVPGDYAIATNSPENVDKRVIAFQNYDAHTDGSLDVRDLVATIKLAEDKEIAMPSQAARLGADINKDKGINEEDIVSVRERLLSDIKTKRRKAVSFEYLGNNVMPITGFYGPYSDNEVDGSTSYISEKYFKLIDDLGVNLIVWSNTDYATSAKSAMEYLRLASEHGIGVFVNDSTIVSMAGRNAISSSTLAGRIASYSNYDSFCGMYVVDEPDTSSYFTEPGDRSVSKYGELARDLQYDLGLNCYLNMYPMWNYTAERKTNYEKYVQEFCETLRPKVLMWDNYPFESAEGLEVYFYNMSIMREYSDKYNIPFWSYIQAGGQWNDDKGYFTSKPYYPDEGQFDWNVNTSLAFGAQGIQYYPLIQPMYYAYAGTEDSPTWDFGRNGMIGANGAPTQWYGYAQQIHTHIAAIDEVLMNAEHLGVIVNAANEGTILDDTCDVSEQYVLATGVDGSSSEGTAACYQEIMNVDGESMIGYFDYDGKTALYVVNYDMESAQNITLEFDKTYQVKQIQNAIETNVNTQSIALDMAAGEGVLLILE